MRVVIAGAGSVGRSVARELIAGRHEVLLIDHSADEVQSSRVPDTSWLLADACEMTALNEALASLPDRQRQAVVLRHIEGLSNPEIAEVMQIGVEAVESLTARGKRALAAAMAGRRAELGYEEGH